MKKGIFIALLMVILSAAGIGAESLTLEWQANTEPDIQSYNLYQGTASRIYNSPIPVGNVTKYQVDGLVLGNNYFFAITAVDTSGNESGYSTELEVTMAPYMAPPPPPSSPPPSPPPGPGSDFFEDDFEDGDYTEWEIVDEGNNAAPSFWNETGGIFTQSSNIYGGSSSGTEPFEPGTYALRGDSSWTDYSVDLKMRSQDDDGIGVMFRYQDSDNYYLFSMGKQRQYRKLTKMVNGSLTVLAEDAVQYNENQWYSVRIEAQGNSIKVYFDGVLLFDVQDDSITNGKIGLFSWGNAGSEFDDIKVAPFIIIFLEDDFEDGNYTEWEIVDEGNNYAPSSWNETGGVFTQNSNIFGGSSNGTEPFEPGTYALRGDSSWTDYSVDLKMRSQDDDGIGIMFRYQDSDNYYLFSMGKQRQYRKLTKLVNGSLTVLAEDAVQYNENQWYSVRIEAQGDSIKVYLDGVLLFDVQDDSITSGKIGLFSWGNTGSEFDDIMVSSSSSSAPQSPEPDTTPPEIAITSPAGTGVYETKAAAIDLAGISSDNIGVTQIKWDNSKGGSGTIEGNENWIISSIFLLEGDNLIILAAMDEAGNEAGTTIIVTYTPPDITPPALAITSPASGGTYETDQASIDISGTASDNIGIATITWVDSNGNSGNAVGKETWSVSGMVLAEGGNTITITAYDEAGNSMDQALIINYTKSSPASFADDFSDGNYTGWQVVDEGKNYAPSSWSVKNGVLYQGSNIYGGNANGTEPFKPGTYTLTGETSWTDYSVDLKMRSQDDDGVGIMFRYQDSDNYYLFSMGKQRLYRKLTKMANGSLTILAEDTVQYNVNQWYAVRIEVQGSTIKVFMDSTLLFDVQDSSISSGKIGLFSWGNVGGEFDDIRVNSSASMPADLTPPDLAITLPVSGGTYATDQASIDISGTASDNVGITAIAWANSEGGSGTAQGLENWTIADVPLKEGINIIVVVAMDAAKNSTSKTLTVTYTLPDTTLPELSITSPVSGATYATDQASIDIAGIASDNVGIATITWIDTNGNSGNAAGKETWSVSGIMLAEGKNTITVTARDDAGNSLNKTLTVYYTKPLAALVEDDFGDGDYSGWQIVDEGVNAGPSSWSVKNGVLYQGSNIYGGNVNGTEPFKPGTYALTGETSWTDYIIDFKMRSQDDDGIGIMFRYQDSDNYYLFSMGKQRQYRKLTKLVNGSLTVLAEDTVQYGINQWYSVRVEVQGSQIKVYMDNSLLFDVQDSSISNGKIGLYSWGNAGSEFDDIFVE